MKHTISFPGLKIGPFTISDTAFSLKFGDSSLDIKWYGIIITFGIILSAIYIYKRTKDQKLILDDLCDLFLFTLPIGILGARLYYMFMDSGNGSAASHIFANSQLSLGEKLLELINLRNGGLAIYGGIIFGTITILSVCKYKKIKALKFFDAVGPAVMLAQAVGRWGNFFNAEAYGSKTTLPWRMGIVPNIDSLVTTYFYHPTFLYECLWNLIGFALINIFYKKKKFDGQWFLAYVGWYGLGRAFIELLRTDSLWIFNHTIRVSSLVGAIAFILSVVFSFILYKRAKNRPLDDCIYYPDAKSYVALMKKDSEKKENAQNKEPEKEENKDIPDEKESN